MFILSLLTTAILGSAPPQVLDVVELVKNAQATNAALVTSGTMKFQTSYELEGKRLVQAEGTFTWSGDDGLWVFKLSDPDAVSTGRQTYTAPISEAVTEYMLLTKGKVYDYNVRGNTLNISAARERDRISSSFYLFDLFPEDLWHHCCPPEQGGGRPWRDMLAPGSPVSRPGSTHEVVATGANTYRFTRRDQDGGVMEDDVSLDLAGYITSHKYTAATANATSRHVTYEWNRLPGGAVVLKSCTSERSHAGKPSTTAERYVMNAEILNVGKNPTPSKFKVADFENLLPRNTKVVDNITNRAYPLRRDAGPPADRLEDLSKELKEGGLLKEVRP